MLDGLELCTDPTDSSVWTYVPPGPFLELGPDGRPALGVVDAGPVSFLQITTRLDLPDAAKDSLAGRLPHPQRPPATVRAATVAVTRVAVETRPPDGVWASAAEGVSSNVPPWTGRTGDAVRDLVGVGGLPQRRAGRNMAPVAGGRRAESGADAGVRPPGR